MEIDDSIISFNIKKKNSNDDIEGEYWVSYCTDGCGCCSDSYCELEPKNSAIKKLKKYIEIKETELKDLKKQLRNISKG